MGDKDRPVSTAMGDQGYKGSTKEYREVLESAKFGEEGRTESKVEDRKGNQQSELTENLKPGSWVTAVQGKKILKRYNLDIQMKDGIESVTVPEEVFKDAAPLWDEFLIGRFLEKAPHIAKVHAIVNKIWALSDKTQMIDVYEINSTTMKFKVGNPITRNRIIRRAMWNIAEIPVVMAKWFPLIEDIKQETHSIPLWVHMKNVPMDMFTWKGLSFVSSPVGTPIRLHPETEQCVNLKVVKIFVKVDLSKEMPKSMNFTFRGKETRVEYSYPWLPPRCSCCMKWGHLARVCRGKKIADENAEENGEAIRDLEKSTLEIKDSEYEAETSVVGKSFAEVAGSGKVASSVVESGKAVVES